MGLPDFTNLKLQLEGQFAGTEKENLTLDSTLNSTVSTTLNTTSKHSTNTDKYRLKSEEYTRKCKQARKMLDKANYRKADEETLAMLYTQKSATKEQIQIQKTSMWEAYSNLPVSEGTDACREILELYGTELQ